MLASGRLTKQKGFDLLLDAWKLTKERHNGWKLRIIGSGKMKAMLEKKLFRLTTEEFIYDILRSEYYACMKQKGTGSVVKCKGFTTDGYLVAKLVQVTLIA